MTRSRRIAHSLVDISLFGIISNQKMRKINKCDFSSNDSINSFVLFKMLPLDA